MKEKVVDVGCGSRSVCVCAKEGNVHFTETTVESMAKTRWVNEK